jgi:hypothetical protein
MILAIHFPVVLFNLIFLFTALKLKTTNH